jgi:glycosyltransferase involved in cell wall biosynthesis
VVLGVQRGGDRLRVALDATPLIGPRTGVGRFCHGALGALGQRAELDVGAFAVTWRRRSWLTPLVPHGVHVRQRAMPARPLHMLWARRTWPAMEWFLGALDVVHGTNFVVPPTRRAARVVTVHDLTALRFPELCDRASLAFPRMVVRAIAEGAWVHTPSRFVADEVVTELGADPARVRVVYHGAPAVTSELGQAELFRDPRRARDAPRSLPAGTSRYVLAVGTVEPRKDYAGLVRAFERVAGAHDDVSLVIAGGDGWGASAFHDAVEGSRWRARIVQLGYLSDGVLARWLAGADVLAFPSVYEGFGFPPLEAMAAGVPVVATAAGAVPEIVGDAAVVVAPSNVDDLAAALDAVLSDRGGAVVAELVAKGRCRAARYTWEACAGGLSALYTDAAAAT